MKSHKTQPALTLLRDLCNRHQDQQGAAETLKPFQRVVAFLPTVFDRPKTAVRYFGATLQSWGIPGTDHGKYSEPPQLYFPAGQ